MGFFRILTKEERFLYTASISVSFLLRFQCTTSVALLSISTAKNRFYCTIPTRWKDLMWRNRIPAPHCLAQYTSFQRMEIGPGRLSSCSFYRTFYACKNCHQQGSGHSKSTGSSLAARISSNREQIGAYSWEADQLCLDMRKLQLVLRDQLVEFHVVQ